MMTDGAGQEVTQESAEIAVAAFAQLWGHGFFDCGPQDYAFMCDEIIESLHAYQGGKQIATRKMNYDEFIKHWWKTRFTDADEPTWKSAISCADASDLLRAFYKHL
jgi:hypothetical protein